MLHVVFQTRNHDNGFTFCEVDAERPTALTLRCFMCSRTRHCSSTAEHRLLASNLVQFDEYFNGDKFVCRCDVKYVLWLFC